MSSALTRTGKKEGVNCHIKAPKHGGSKEEEYPSLGLLSLSILFAMPAIG